MEFAETVLQPRLEVSGGPLSFDTVLVGESKDLSFTVSNSGEGTLTGSVSVTAPFSFVAGASFSLGAGESQQVIVRFAPTAVGLFSANATVNSDGGARSVGLTGTGDEPRREAPPLEVPPAPLDFGSVTVGSSKDLSFTVTNNREETLTVNISTVAPFSVVTEVSFSLAAGQSQEVTVRFSPTSPGPVGGTVEVSTTNANSEQVSLSGTGVTCSYAITPASQSFAAEGGAGSVSVSTTPESGCNWTAVSNVPWVTITAGSSGSGAGTVSYTVAANTEASERTGTLTIAGQAFTITHTITQEAPPILEVSPSALDFGTVTVGTSTDLSFTVTNSGDGMLTGNVSTAAPFSIVTGASFSLAAKQSQQVTVRFTPTVPGSANGSAAVSSNGGSAPVGLTGIAEQPPQLCIEPNSLDFDGVPVDSSQEQNLTVTNGFVA